MKIPTKDGYFEVDNEMLSALKKVYAYTDVVLELSKMIVRFESKPARRWKTRTFMVGATKWLKKENEQAKINGGRIRQPKIMDAWWTSDPSTLHHGESIGIKPRPGETMAQYRDRLKAAS